ncbi:PREDICTED: uncharacterized protein LOC104609049 isoform X2 [Nelumbo nucifera]|nr:PREDICTED: uncharacterized protein LOC104609049 isoform X2 [Nelumbo nucifera]XP_019055266.1 PREDICTED: uncharacterized protein LOC104609049 isoform X2 [Nelumbo nucifera]
MCASTPNLVYKRRKLQRNSVALLSDKAATNTKGSVGFLSSLSSEGPLQAAKQDQIGSQIKQERTNFRSPDLPTDLCNRDLVSENASNCQQIYQPNLENVPCIQINQNWCLNVVSKSETIVGCSSIPRNLENGPCRQIDCTGGLDVVSKSECIIECSIGEENVRDEAPNTNVCKPGIGYYSVNDSCSSSKSCMELVSASTKTEGDDTGECSSSDNLAIEVLAEDLSEKELCISILRSHGLLEKFWPARACASTEVLGIGTDSNCLRSCKICSRSDNPLKMLLCDHCEEAFHVSCCNPKVKKIPVDEWYCPPCLKKKCKLSSESAPVRSSNVSSGMPEYRNTASKGDLGPISLMLRDTKSYTSGVRIGKAFQAEVPDWTGPVSNNYDSIGEPFEMDATEHVCFHGWNSKKSSTPSSIGNWLQCREVLYDDTGAIVEGHICGKWRRAPLFEVQTDDWDCSCAVLWDPIHSDCAVPQELETDQVLMHLKYIGLLRPRLTAKRKKLNRTKSDSSEQVERT